MEDTKTNKTEYCLGCLCHIDEFNLQCYKFQSETLKTLFQVENIYFCYICKSLAQKAEQFIQNVQTNQIFMENFQKITDTSIETARIEFTPPISLTKEILHSIELTDNGDIEEATFTTYSTCRVKDIKVKLELKEEEALDNFDDDFIDENDFQESHVKEEDDFPLNKLIKAENDELLEDISLKKLRKTLKRSKVKKKNVQSKPEAANLDKTVYVIHISKQQLIRERNKMKKDPRYINSVHKCEDCIKGFTFKDSYEKHMEKHSKALGEYECDICKQRMGTTEKLLSHQRYHRIRYKCSECDLTRISRLTVKDHYSAFHISNPFQFKCAHCSKAFKRQVSLRKHIAYSHVTKKRAKCQYCQKTYASRESLKSHMIGKHAAEVSSDKVRIKQHVCPECGFAFKSPSHLKNHMVKHSITRDYYCVECDRSFKSSNALKQHLKIAAPHVNYMDQPLQCPYCEKKFSIKRDLERHKNRVHLNVRPFQCDKCDKAYVNAWSLTEHKRFTHEGIKRPMKFPCPMCDKIFNRSETRKAHIRTHTGERPYGCTKCPAKFGQASVLATHVKLVHLKLTRDGRPKASVAVK